MHWWQAEVAIPKQPQGVGATGDGRVNEKGKSKQPAAGGGVVAGGEGQVMTAACLPAPAADQPSEK